MFWLDVSRTDRLEPYHSIQPPKKTLHTRDLLQGRVPILLVQIALHELVPFVLLGHGPRHDALPVAPRHQLLLLGCSVVYRCCCGVVVLIRWVSVCAHAFMKNTKTWQHKHTTLAATPSTMPAKRRAGLVLFLLLLLLLLLWEVGVGV